jgi:hypothetical protein
VQVTRLGRVVAKLLAQPADVHVERLRGTEPVHVPHLVDQALAADDGTGLAHQQREQVELLPRELERLAGESDASARPVQPDLPHLERAGGRPGGRVRAA